MTGVLWERDVQINKVWRAAHYQEFRIPNRVREGCVASSFFPNCKARLHVCLHILVDGENSCRSVCNLSLATLNSGHGIVSI